MKVFGAGFVRAALLAVVLGGSTGPSDAAAEYRVRPGEVVVRYTKSGSAAGVAAAGLAVRSKLGDRYASISIGISTAAADSFEPLTDPAPYEAACSDLKSRGIVDRCSPNYEVRALVTPDDSGYQFLYGMTNISAPGAWDLTTGSGSVIVGVNDTGIDYTHPDLVDNMWVNPGESAGNGVDDDNNGYVDDIYGVNAIVGSGDPFDDNEHGTHVSGTIGARGNNGIGVAGVNWNVKLMGLKFLAADGTGSVSDAITALDYGLQKGVSVVNASWGGAGYSDTLESKIGELGDAGIIFVAAAGNSGRDLDSLPSYPGSYSLPNMITVAASNEDDNLADFSNYGSASVQIGAPGVSILSTVPGGGYAYLDGTSMATPHVAGLAALLLSVTPGLSPAQLRGLIINNADAVAGLSGVTQSGRRINAAASVIAAQGVTPAPPTSGITLSAGPYAAAFDLFTPGGKIKKPCQIRLNASADAVAQHGFLRLTVRGKSCTVAEVDLAPSEERRFSCSAVPFTKGKATFKFVDDSSNEQAQTVARYGPSGAFLTFADYNAAKLCQKIARRITAQ